MRRTVKDLLVQNTQSVLPRVKQYTCHIVEVEIPSHEFVVNVAGYGRITVKADQSIDFGSTQYPKVYRGNDCKILKDDSTGHWRATEYIKTNRCIPTTGANVPNVPLPSYSPPIPIFPPVNPPSFPPIIVPSIPLPPFNPPGLLPPTLSTVYDIGDGIQSIPAATIQDMLYFTTADRFKIVRVTLYCVETDVSLSVFATNGTYADLIAVHNPDGIWTISVNDPSSGFVLETIYSSIVSSSAVVNLGIPVAIPIIGTLFKSQIATGANAVTGFGYGLGGSLY